MAMKMQEQKARQQQMLGKSHVLSQALAVFHADTVVILPQIYGYSSMGVDYFANRNFSVLYR